VTLDLVTLEQSVSIALRLLFPLGGHIPVKPGRLQALEFAGVIADRQHHGGIIRNDHTDTLTIGIWQRAQGSGGHLLDAARLEVVLQQMRELLAFVALDPAPDFPRVVPPLLGRLRLLLSRRQLLWRKPTPHSFSAQILNDLAVVLLGALAEAVHDRRPTVAVTDLQARTLAIIMTGTEALAATAIAAEKVDNPQSRRVETLRIVAVIAFRR